MRLLTFATIAIGALASAGASAATLFQENFSGGLGTFTSSGTAWLRWQIGGETDRRSMFIGAGCYFCGGIWSTRSKNW